MRIVAGEFRGRRLVVPEGVVTRPTADRVREAVFNSLFSLGVIEDGTVLDAFAGSGALGIEAISRGAGHATLVENDPRALEALRDNLESLGIAARASVVAGDGVAAVAERAGRDDIVLLDPPYQFDDWSTLLAPVVGATVVIESDREIEVPETWHRYHVRRYGGTVVTLAAAPTP